ncbi:MAG TPA: hypothetical protein VFW07_12320 [Parafilimonas sp.]|nr:hypothetical protein [Parafilimonas sp.]
MKRILLAATLIVAITSAAFADGKKADAKFLSHLKASLKGVNESSWKTTEFYKKTSFSVNGKTVNAYLDADDGSLVGFAIAINAASLPDGATADIAKKFEGWRVTNAIMFIEPDGKIKYFAQVNKGKNNLALSVSQKGKANIYARMPR